MANLTHHIQRFRIDYSCPGTEGYLDLIESAKPLLVEAIEEVFGGIEAFEAAYHIGKLLVEIEPLREEVYLSQLPSRFKKKLKHELSRLIKEDTDRQPSKITQSNWEALKQYLNHGFLPWWFSNENRDALESLFSEIWFGSRSVIFKWFQERSLERPQIRRLAQLLRPGELWELVKDSLKGEIPSIQIAFSELLVILGKMFPQIPNGKLENVLSLGVLEFAASPTSKGKNLNSFLSALLGRLSQQYLLEGKRSNRLFSRGKGDLQSLFYSEMLRIVKKRRVPLKLHDSLLAILSDPEFRKSLPKPNQHPRLNREFVQLISYLRRKGSLPIWAGTFSDTEVRDQWFKMIQTRGIGELPKLLSDLKTPHLRRLLQPVLQLFLVQKSEELSILKLKKLVANMPLGLREVPEYKVLATYLHDLKGETFPLGLKDAFKSVDQVLSDSPPDYPSGYWIDLVQYYLLTLSWPWWGRDAVRKVQSAGYLIEGGASKSEFLTILTRVIIESPEAGRKVVLGILKEHQLRGRMLHFFNEPEQARMLSLMAGKEEHSLPSQIQGLLKLLEEVLPDTLDRRRMWSMTVNWLFTAIGIRGFENCFGANIRWFWACVGMWKLVLNLSDETIWKAVEDFGAYIPGLPSFPNENERIVLGFEGDDSPGDWKEERMALLLSPLKSTSKILGHASSLDRESGSGRGILGNSFQKESSHFAQKHEPWEELLKSKRNEIRISSSIDLLRFFLFNGAVPTSNSKISLEELFGILDDLVRGRKVKEMLSLFRGKGISREFIKAYWARVSAVLLHFFPSKLLLSVAILLWEAKHIDSTIWELAFARDGDSKLDKHSKDRLIYWILSVGVGVRFVPSLFSNDPNSYLIKHFRKEWPEIVEFMETGKMNNPDLEPSQKRGRTLPKSIVQSKETCLLTFNAFLQLGKLPGWSVWDEVSGLQKAVLFWLSIAPVSIRKKFRDWVKDGQTATVPHEMMQLLGDSGAFHIQLKSLLLKASDGSGFSIPSPELLGAFKRYWISSTDKFQERSFARRMLSWLYRPDADKDWISFLNQLLIQGKELVEKSDKEELSSLIPIFLKEVKASLKNSLNSIRAVEEVLGKKLRFHFSQEFRPLLLTHFPALTLPPQVAVSEPLRGSPEVVTSRNLLEFLQEKFPQALSPVEWRAVDQVLQPLVPRGSVAHMLVGWIHYISARIQVPPAQLLIHITSNPHKRGPGNYETNSIRTLRVVLGAGELAGINATERYHIELGMEFLFLTYKLLGPAASKRWRNIWKKHGVRSIDRSRISEFIVNEINILTKTVPSAGLNGTTELVWHRLVRQFPKHYSQLHRLPLAFQPDLVEMESSRTPSLSVEGHRFSDLDRKEIWKYLEAFHKNGIPDQSWARLIKLSQALMASKGLAGLRISLSALCYYLEGLTGKSEETISSELMQRPKTASLSSNQTAVWRVIGEILSAKGENDSSLNQEACLAMETLYLVQEIFEKDATRIWEKEWAQIEKAGFDSLQIEQLLGRVFHHSLFPREAGRNFAWNQEKAVSGRWRILSESNHSQKRLQELIQRIRSLAPKRYRFLRNLGIVLPKVYRETLVSLEREKNIGKTDLEGYEVHGHEGLKGYEHHEGYDGVDGHGDHQGLKGYEDREGHEYQEGHEGLEGQEYHEGDEGLEGQEYHEGHKSLEDHKDHKDHEDYEGLNSIGDQKDESYERGRTRIIDLLIKISTSSIPVAQKQRVSFVLSRLVIGNSTRQIQEILLGLLLFQVGTKGSELNKIAKSWIESLESDATLPDEKIVLKILKNILKGNVKLNPRTSIAIDTQIFIHQSLPLRAQDIWDRIWYEKRIDLLETSGLVAFFREVLITEPNQEKRFRIYRQLIGFEKRVGIKDLRITLFRELDKDGAGLALTATEDLIQLDENGPVVETSTSKDLADLKGAVNSDVSNLERAIERKRISSLSGTSPQIKRTDIVAYLFRHQIRRIGRGDWKALVELLGVLLPEKGASNLRLFTYSLLHYTSAVTGESKARILSRWLSIPKEKGLRPKEKEVLNYLRKLEGIPIVQFSSSHKKDIESQTGKVSLGSSLKFEKHFSTSKKPVKRIVLGLESLLLAQVVVGQKKKQTWNRFWKNHGFNSVDPEGLTGHLLTLLFPPASKKNSSQLRRQLNELLRRMKNIAPGWWQFIPAILEDFLAEIELHVKIGLSGPGTKIAKLEEEKGIKLEGLTDRQFAGILARNLQDDRELFSRIEERPLQSKVSQAKKEKIRYDRQSQQQDWAQNSEPETKIYIQNAGLVIVWPFLARFLQHIGFLEKEEFVDDEAQERAVFLMQYLVDGDLDPPLHLLSLNKLLCGLPPEAAVDLLSPISEEERDHASKLLEAVKGYWKPLKNTSIKGMQETFFQREGILQRKGEHWHLKVDKKGFDVLVKQLNWSLKTISLPYSEFILHVEWT